ncbi:MAG: GAF domain-containing protein [Acidobacteriia bacterium]|nr:GAF domain-containing protein [Terriglobia bacterium]
MTPTANPAVAARSRPEPISSVKLDQFLLEVADVVNTTLDLDTLLKRVAELVRRVIDYEIFAILLVNEKTQELRSRFQIGHPPEVAERLRVKIGQGVTGQAALRREAVLVNDVAADRDYIACIAGVKAELAIPLIIKNRCIGVLDINARQRNYFTDEHARLLTVIASRIAIAIENARLYTRVARQAQSLKLLNEISRELTSILNLDQLLKRIGDLLNRIIDYQMFSILLLDNSGQILQHRFSVRFNESVQIKHDIPLGRGLVGYAAQKKEPVLVPDVSKDPRYIKANPETRSELCVPLIYMDKVIGVLDLEHTKRGYFTDDHMRTITTLAAQVAIAVENARLYEQVTKQEQRLERDLSMARQIQFRLLPQCCPTMGNAELAAKFVPAQAIGGDMYDFLEYSSHSTAIAIGDVSGKGAPAALYAALVSGMLRSNAGMEPSPAEMLSMINLALAERAVDAQFVSMIYAVWEDDDGIMRIANSGLPRPIYCHRGQAEAVECTGLPLGLFADAEHDEVTIRPDSGDVFLFFSDGITDALSSDGDLFGRQRVEEIVQANCERSADEIVTAIFKAVAEHAAGLDPFDDQTIVAIKIKPSKPEVSKSTKPGKKK